MRTAFAIVLGIVIGAAIAVVVMRWSGGANPSTVAVGVGGSVTPVASPEVAAAIPAAPRPIDEAPMARAPAERPIVANPDQPSPYAAPQSIYRCVVNGRTTYSNDPCPNGKVVDESSAVAGFDSRASQKLERLVANGRTSDLDAAPAPQASRSRPVVSGAPYDDCSTMRRQIRDIDERTRYPNDPRVLDDLRQTRQDIRTSMARLHC